MLTLSGISIKTVTMAQSRRLFRLTKNPEIPKVLRENRALLCDKETFPTEGFNHYFVFQDFPNELLAGKNYSILSREFSYLGENDIVGLSNDGRLRVLFRANSEHNSILLTERCNNYCLMCSQPPKDVDDSWLLDEALTAIEMVPRSTKSLGFTGGEPTLYGQKLIELLNACKSWIPETGIHLLSNGRAFSDFTFTQSYASINHPDLMVGIPVYSSDPVNHDYVVQAKGAFDETIRGILNLKRLGQKVEIRVVLHKQTYQGLTDLAQFIVRNLLFVDHVALMGLEMMGFTRANLGDLWIDPVEYKNELSKAVDILRVAGIRTSIYNLPLCLINPDSEPAYVKSISDWKNEYAGECAPCKRKDECGGFFSSGIKYGYSKSISPFL